MKRILFIDHSPIPGGASISLFELVRNLDRKLYAPIVGCNSKELSAFYSGNGIKTINLDLALFQHSTAGWWKLSPRGILGMVRWWFHHRITVNNLHLKLDEVKPHIAHLNSLTLTFYLKHIKKHEIKTVLHVRESVVNGYIGFRKKVLKRLTDKYADEVIHICNYNRQALGSSKGTVIYNPVDLEKYEINNKSDTKKNFGIEEDQKVVLYVGGLRKINGPIVFVKSLKSIIKNFPKVTILMPYTRYHPSDTLVSNIKRKIGNTLSIYSPRQLIDRQITENGLDDHVIRLEYYDRIEELYRIADVVVVPFIKPHFSRSILEAWAASKSVVASDIGGISEIVQHGETGLLFTPGNVDELTGLTLQCLIKDTMSKKFGHNGYQVVRAQFNIKEHIDNISTVYEKFQLSTINNA